MNNYIKDIFEYERVLKIHRCMYTNVVKNKRQSQGTKSLYSVMPVVSKKQITQLRAPSHIHNKYYKHRLHMYLM